MIQPSAAPRYVVLDSLRGVCCVMVLLFHLNASSHISALPLVRNAWLFVDFFFVLSGFVISSGYRVKLAQGFPVRRFMLLRLARVYPLHVFVVFLFLALEVAKYHYGYPGIPPRAPFSSPRSIPEMRENLALVQIFGLRDHDSWNVPAWSIAAEVWTYLLAALVFARLPRRIEAVAVATIALSLLVLASTGDGFLNRTHDMALVRCLLGFSCGVLGQRVLQKYGPIGTNSAVEIVMAAVVIAFVSFAQGYVTLAAPFVLLAAVLVFASERGIVSAGLRCRPLVALGTISYSIYMVHTFVQGRSIDILLVLSRITGFELAHVARVGGAALKAVGAPDSLWLGDVLTVLITAACIGTAKLTYDWIEEPFRRASRRRIEPAVARTEDRPVAF